MNTPMMLHGTQPGMPCRNPRTLVRRRNTAADFFSHSRSKWDHLCEESDAVFADAAAAAAAADAPIPPSPPSAMPLRGSTAKF